MATFEDNPTATPNSANRITLTPNVSGVTAVRIWRTVNLTGHYYAGEFPWRAPGDIGLPPRSIPPRRIMTTGKARRRSRRVTIPR